MPAIAKKSDKAKPNADQKKPAKKKGNSKNGDHGSGAKAQLNWLGWLKFDSLISLRDCLWLAGFGCLLGLSAPGINQWYLAWVGLAPLILAIAASKNVWQAACRGLVFGLFYNLAYLHWYLGLQPLDWLGFKAWQGWALAIAAWLFASTHQALIIAIFAFLAKLIPTTGSFVPQKIPGGWRLPCVIALPLLWVLIENKIGNAPSALGVPWSMLEYTQYKQLALIQVASVIGGIGIGFLIVMINTQLATLIATYSQKPLYKSIAASGRRVALGQLAAVLALIPIAMVIGHFQKGGLRRPTTPAAVLQGNINIDMQKTKHRYTLQEILDRYFYRAIKLPPGGLLIWTESAVPTLLRDDIDTQAQLVRLSRDKHMDMVVGSIDVDKKGDPFNSAYGFTSEGSLLSSVYHKRYLVPFGEYAPPLVQNGPEWLKRITNTPAGKGLSSGTTAGVLSLSCGKVAPLICFECISPELAADSTRKGGELIVNISDLAWFHRSVIGEQMIAFSVFRAIENQRFFIFAANTGPTAIIDPEGKITLRSEIDDETVVSGKVGFSSRITPFTAWFR